VLGIELEKFFDRVNHDILMSLVAKREKDKRFLKLLRAYLNAGVMEAGLVSPATEGTMPGELLSPLLSNLMLVVLDKELERPGHRFVCYVADCNIYVRSVRAGERVMANVSQFLEKQLKLKVNQGKSAVARPGGTEVSGF
jgi:RNA-directed DNA polymerase